VKHYIAVTLAFLIALTVGGCTIVTVGPSGKISSVRPGVLKIEPVHGAAMIAYRARGLGVVAGRSGPTIGWAQEDAVLVYDKERCAIVVFDQPDNIEAMHFWRKLAEERPNICLTGGK